jgi:hypothetical protein
MGVDGQHQAPKAGSQYLLQSRLGGHQGRSVEVQKIFPPLGFEPQTIQPMASCYIDYAILAYTLHITPSQQIMKLSFHTAPSFNIFHK